MNYEVKNFRTKSVAKRKRKRPQPVEPTSGQDGTEAERMCPIPQLDGDGDVSLSSETASQPATPPPPPPPATPPRLTPPPPPSDPAIVKNIYNSCVANPIFNYDRRKCKDSLKTLVCTKCFSTLSE
jgi:hypothetical protein